MNPQLHKTAVSGSSQSDSKTRNFAFAGGKILIFAAQLLPLTPATLRSCGIMSRVRSANVNKLNKIKRSINAEPAIAQNGRCARVALTKTQRRFLLYSREVFQFSYSKEFFQEWQSAEFSTAKSKHFTPNIPTKNLQRESTKQLQNLNPTQNIDSDLRCENLQRKSGI